MPHLVRRARRGLPQDQLGRGRPRGCQRYRVTGIAFTGWALHTRSHLFQGGIRDLLAKYPPLSALRSAGRARVALTLKARSPRLTETVATSLMAAFEAQRLSVPGQATIGRVVDGLAGELDRAYAREALAAEIEEVFLADPLPRGSFSASCRHQRLSGRLCACFRTRRQSSLYHCTVEGTTDIPPS